MNEQKGLFTQLGEVIDRYRAAGRAAVPEPPARIAQAMPLRKRRSWLHWLGRQMIPNLGTLLLVLVLLVAVPSLAAPLRALTSASTSTISYQGRLANSAGNPLTGKYNLEFRLYDVPTGGTSLWTEYWTGGNAVDVSDGLFNVMLGSINNTLPTAIQGHDELYLGITVGTDSEMTPRVQLGSVPFSMQALTVPDGSITTAKLDDGAVTTVKLATAAITTTNIADGAVTGAKLKSGMVVNRYYLEWFSDETPFSTSSTSYVDFGTWWSSNFSSHFPTPATGTARRYRVVVNHTNDLGTSGDAYLRVYTASTNQTICELALGQGWSASDMQYTVYSSNLENPSQHVHLQARLTEAGHTMWIYRIWVMAEDVIP